MSETTQNEKTTTNGDAIKNEKDEAKKKPRGFFGRALDGFNSLDPAVQVILAVTAGLCALAATGATIETIKSAQDRKTMNSDGFKHIVDRGLLDPVPPAKTLEEAASRIVESSPRLLHVYDPLAA